MSKFSLDNQKTRIHYAKMEPQVHQDNFSKVSEKIVDDVSGSGCENIADDNDDICMGIEINIMLMVLLVVVAGTWLVGWSYVNLWVI